VVGDAALGEQLAEAVDQGDVVMPSRAVDKPQ
jgi:hypothetical protein